MDGNKNILLTNTNSHCIRMLAGADARVIMIAGSSEAGAVDGASARFNQPLLLRWTRVDTF